MNLQLSGKILPEFEFSSSLLKFQNWITGVDSRKKKYESYASMWIKLDPGPKSLGSSKLQIKSV